MSALSDLTEEERTELACDWSDYKADYANAATLDREWVAFQAGWLAARKGTDRGVLR